MKISEFCNRLESAEARFEFVIAVFCDIRSFSNFSKTVESPDTSTFLKHFYLKLLRNYFHDAVFAKPTGDGLLIVFRHDEKNLAQMSELVFSKCFKALKDFPRMFQNIPILNYPPPEAIGFGIARGSASYLMVGEEILDYSGRLLNLAARLNELARPLGVVIDGNYQYEIIPKKFRNKFQKKSVYLRGIAEEFPTNVFFSEQVNIPISALHPIKEHTWKLVFEKNTVAEIKAMKGMFSIILPDSPLFPDQIRAEVVWLVGEIQNIQMIKVCSQISHRIDASGYTVIFSLDEVKELIKPAELKDTAEVSFRVHYIPKPKLIKKSAVN